MLTYLLRALHFKHYGIKYHPSHWPSPFWEDYLRLLFVNHRSQLLPSIPVCLVMIQTHPLPYPRDNRHSTTVSTPFLHTHSIPPPALSTNLARTSIYSHLVQPSSMPRFHSSQLWPKLCSIGVSLAPTVTAIPWTHATQRFSTGEKTASRSQQETQEKNFVLQLSRLFKAFTEKSALESVALKAIMALSILVQQKPFPSSNAKDHASCLTTMLMLWKDGNLNDQSVLEGSHPKPSSKGFPRHGRPNAIPLIRQPDVRRQ